MSNPLCQSYYPAKGIHCCHFSFKTMATFNDKAFKTSVNYESTNTTYFNQNLLYFNFLLRQAITDTTVTTTTATVTIATTEPKLEPRMSPSLPLPPGGKAMFINTA